MQEQVRRAPLPGKYFILIPLFFRNNYVINMFEKNNIRPQIKNSRNWDIAKEFPLGYDESHDTFVTVTQIDAFM